jgi:hypothetical protein
MSTRRLLDDISTVTILVEAYVPLFSDSPRLHQYQVKRHRAGVFLLIEQGFWAFMSKTFADG